MPDTDTVKVYRCPLQECPTPERMYAHEAQFVLHLMGRKGHKLGKRAARKILRAVQAQASNALATTAARAIAEGRVERPVSREERIRQNLASINRLREEIERDIDDERRAVDRRSRDLTRARRLLDAL